MEEKNSKEINLLELLEMLFNWLKKVFKNVLNFIGSLVQLSYRRRFLIIILVAVSVVIGQYLARPSARKYKVEAMAMIYGSDAQTVKQICRKLENADSRNNLTSLKTILSLPDSVAKNVLSIESFYVIDYMRDSVADVVDFHHNHSLSDTVNVRMRDRVYLQIKTRDINQVPRVETALLNYLNSNDLLKSRFESKRNELLQQIQVCDVEMQRIDSMAKIFYFKDSEKQLQFDNNKLLLGEQRKQLFYGELLRLQELKSIANLKLADFIYPVELPSGFVVDPKPINGRVKYGVYSILIGYILALVIAILLEKFSTIFKYLKS